MSSTNHLTAEYYLFGAYFPRALVDGKVVFPTWDQSPSLVEEKSLNNIRPLSAIPMINVTDPNNPELWATNSDFHMGERRV